MCLLEFSFQNLPFSKCAGKNVPFSCEREAYPSHFSPFSNVPAPCERGLNLLAKKKTTNNGDTNRTLFYTNLVALQQNVRLSRV